MNEQPTPLAPPTDRTWAELRQITITSDDQITEVNQAVTDGWRLVAVGFQAQATVYVLGKRDQKQHQSPGFFGSGH